MGLDVASRTAIDEQMDKISLDSTEIGVMVDKVSRLSGQSLHVYLDSLFQRMSLQTKEVVMHMLWGSMQPREQRLLDMPLYGAGPRFSPQAIDSQLDNAFTTNSLSLSDHVTQFELPAIRAFGSLQIRQTAQLPVTRQTNTRESNSRIPAGRRHLRDFEDQIFNVLMDAILRAERTARDSEMGDINDMNGINEMQEMQDNIDHSDHNNMEE